MWIWITFKYKTGNTTVRQHGVSIALKWLFASIRNFGGTPPPEDKTRQEIWNLDIGKICDKKQHFNKFANGKNHKSCWWCGNSIHILCHSEAFSIWSWKLECLFLRYNFAINLRRCTHTQYNQSSMHLPFATT